MNPLYEPFPDYVVVNDKRVRIVTDFREYIKLIDLLKDDGVNTIEKAELIMSWFLDEPAGEFSECLQALSDFVTNYRDRETRSNREEENDQESEEQHSAPYIISGFLECYGIDLTEVLYMHWWKFQMLIDGMNEDCELKKRMGYRSIDLSKIKDKEERERIRKIQKQIAIVDRVITSEEIGDAFGNMMF